MHLFVGNLSKSVKVSDLEAEFDKFGKCKVNIPKVQVTPYPPLLRPSVRPLLSNLSMSTPLTRDYYSPPLSYKWGELLSVWLPHSKAARCL